MSTFVEMCVSAMRLLLVVVGYGCVDLLYYTVDFGLTSQIFWSYGYKIEAEQNLIFA